MAENPQKEYWGRLWQQAYDNVPCKIIKRRAVSYHWVDENGEKCDAAYMDATNKWRMGKKIVTAWVENVTTDEGKAPTLMLLLGKPMFSKNGTRRSHKLHWEAARYGGFRPRDPEVRRKLEIIAGPNGKLMAWLKLKELGLAGKYEAPR